MNKFCIDGKFLEKDIGGQTRYGKEIVKELDKLIDKDEIELIVPMYVENIPEYKNIKVVKYGNKKGFFWEQIDFLRYLKNNNKMAIYLCNTWPVFRPDIATIHDVSVFDVSHIYKNFYGKGSVLFHKILFKSAAKRAKVIFTISYFSKNEIIKYLNVKGDKIKVLDVGWQHMKKIKSDIKIFEKYPQLIKGEYFLSVSSLTPQKNFVWVEKTAKHNKECFFVIAGKKVALTVDDSSDLNNLLYLGKVTDGEMKALMENCKAFIHPALYEGFGMTPIEAMAAGAPVIISNAACLPEVYEDCAHYIDPYNPNVDLEKILQEKIQPAQKILDKYSWENCANELLKKIKEI